MQIATVVIPNLNGMKYLKDCLDSLRRQTRTDFSVILIDNGSTDGSADYVAQNYPGVRVERFSENRGFCGAVNAGIRMSSTRYVILLNNDTICDAQFVEQLVAAMEAHPDCFAGSSRMVQMADPSRMDNGGDFYCALAGPTRRQRASRWSAMNGQELCFPRAREQRFIAGLSLMKSVCSMRRILRIWRMWMYHGGRGFMACAICMSRLQWSGMSGVRQAVRCTTNSRCGMHRGTAFI